MLPTIKFRNLLSLVCLTLVVTFSAPELASAPAPEETWSLPQQRAAEPSAPAPEETWSLPQQHAEPSALASAPAPGETFRDCPNCPEMVVIPAGRFRMGDINGHSPTRGGVSREKPVHEVRIAQPFMLGRYEVTFAEYDRYAQATGKTKPDDRGRGRGNYPVSSVNWEDAQGYVKWLSQETGQRYRLPSEAEWEYAARAGSTSVYSFGNDETRLCQWGNGADETPPPDGGYLMQEHTTCRDGYAFATAPVGSFKRNAWGVADMIGNVKEWVEDCWHFDYQGAPVDGSAWVSGDNCEYRVVRGGSFISGPVKVRPAYRNGEDPNERYSTQGFRLARTL